MGRSRASIDVLKVIFSRRDQILTWPDRVDLVLLKSLGFPLYSVLVFRHADQVNYQISLVEFLQSTQLINFKTSIEARLRPMRSYSLCGGASQAWDRLGAW